MKVILRSALILTMALSAATLSAQPHAGHGNGHGPGRQGHSRMRGERPEHKTPEQKAEIISQKMAEKLALSDDQTKKIYTLELARAESHLQARNKETGSREEARNEFRQQMQQHDAEMRAILTDGQYKQWTELRKEGRHRPDADRKKTSRSKTKKNNTPKVTD